MTNSKVVNGKKLVVVSKETQKALSVPTKKLTKKQVAKVTVAKVAKVKVSLKDRQSELISKETKTVFDFVKLANVTDKIENKTASKVYKNIKENVYSSDILGGSKFPSFTEFTSKLAVKDSYSNWDGYKVLAKFNVKATLTSKVARQNKAEAKK
jgi:hypothetical protein